MSRFARTNPHPDLFAGLVREQPAPPVTPDAPTAKAPDAIPCARRNALVWIAIYLPSLALQAVQEQCQKDRGCVVIEDDPMQSVAATNKSARRSGVFPGQALRSALALDADLQVLERQQDAEQTLLTDLASALLVFTNSVSLQPPQSILLEVSGSLRLFSGITALCEKLAATLRSQQFFFRCSVAPTAQAAYWFAKVGYYPPPTDVVADGHHCAAVLRGLNALDISVTEWPAASVQALAQMGVRTLADCRRLPKSGLLRRFGPELLQSLAQAFGELPEVRLFEREPAIFSAIQSLDAEISDAPQLADACTVLLQQLVVFCRERQATVSELRFHFHAWRGSAGVLTLQLSSPGYQQDHWQRLLAAHLERCTLEQPAVAISLTSTISGTMSAQSASLQLSHADAMTAVADAHATSEFLDRLRARLGDDAVAALQHVNSRCPASASKVIQPSTLPLSQAQIPADWQLQGVEQDKAPALIRQRPLWLLQPPQPIRCVDGELYCEGLLQLRSGPERIEPPWWESTPMVRDYFIAETATGARLWVFRQRNPEQAAPDWWLQGVFG